MPKVSKVAKERTQFDLIIMDGLNLCFRYNYGMGYLKSRKGVRTGMFHGFLSKLVKLRIENPRARLVVVWEGGDLVRKRIIDDYKANRPKVKDSFKQQCSKLVDLLGMLDIEQKFVPGYEADDAAATLVEEAGKKRVLLVTNDKDWNQMMCPDRNVCVMLKNDPLSYDQMRRKLGFPPDRFALHTLMKGKTGNNVKGIHLFPTVLASEIVKNCANLSRVYKFEPSDPKHRKWIVQMRTDRVELSERYVALRLRNDLQLEDYPCAQKNLTQLRLTLRKMEMFKVIELIRRARSSKKSVSSSKSQR